MTAVLAIIGLVVATSALAAVFMWAAFRFASHLPDAHQLDGFDLHDGATMRADRRNRLTAVNTEIERAATEAREAGKW